MKIGGITTTYNEIGQRKHLSGLIPDTSERNPTGGKSERSLRETLELNAAFDEHAIVAITDPHGKITYANDKFCAISKYSREELIGKDHRIINSDYHPREFFLDLWTTIAHGKVWKGEIRNKAKDGSFYWVYTTIVPFLNKEGKPDHYVAIRTDITERKQADLDALRMKSESLQASLEHITKLKGVLLTMCAWTKKVKVNDEWISVEEFLHKHLGIELTHGISDEALTKVLSSSEAPPIGQPNSP